MINTIWYHGTSEQNISHFNRITNWFTTDIDYANQFGNIIYNCTIEPKKIWNIGCTDTRIFDLFPIKPYRFSKEFAVIAKYFDETELRRILLQLAFENGYEAEGYKMPIFTFIRSKFFAAKAKELGYDAISTIEFGHECLGVLDQTIITINKKLYNKNMKENYKETSKNTLIESQDYFSKDFLINHVKEDLKKYKSIFDKLAE